jgi:hypothetical protein
MRKMAIFASKTQFFTESGSGKHFQGSGMRAIDSPHKITPYGIIFERILRNKFSILDHVQWDIRAEVASDF